MPPTVCMGTIILDMPAPPVSVSLNPAKVWIFSGFFLAILLLKLHTCENYCFTFCEHADMKEKWIVWHKHHFLLFVLYGCLVEKINLFFKQALIPKLKDQDPNVVISVLAAIGEHAQVSFRETNILYIT